MTADTERHTASHFAGGIIYREGDEGREYLVIEYNSGDGVQIKFPGGTNNDHVGEEMLNTLNRELEEETGLTIGSAQSIHDVPKPEHLKRFFLISFDECTGTLRTEAKIDDGDKLSPPFWRTAKELLQDVKRGGLFWSHRPGLHAAMKFEG